MTTPSLIEQPVVSVSNLRVAYGTFEAVKDFSFNVHRGEVFGLVGPNGAGKTSTLKVLAGLLRPSAGSASVCGYDVVRQPHDARRRIGYMADFFGVYDYLTVDEYLSFFGGMYGMKGSVLDEGISAAIAKVALQGKRKAFIHTLSRGMKQRLYLARAFVHRPEALILDEPASGMDPRGRDAMVRTLKTLAGEGTTVVISSHILDELEDLCTDIGVMEAGRFAGIHRLRLTRQGDKAGKRYFLHTPEKDRSRALALAKAMDQVKTAGPASDGIWLDIAGGETAVSEITRAMVGAGIPVLLPAAEKTYLRDIFMRMTKGEIT